MIKTLIVNLPPLDTLKPPLSGAILSAICTKQGHECVAVDMQQELNHYLTSNDLPADLFDDVFFEHSPAFNTAQCDRLSDFIDQELSRLRIQKYDYVLISLFSYLAQSFATIFLPRLRSSTTAKVIIGGAGLISKQTNGAIAHYANDLKKRNLIDEYITGEAEQALPMYFEQGRGPGIGNDNFKQIDDLDAQVWPDYQFYDISRYKQTPHELAIIGSRGCVRKCTFCDVARTTPKYRFRSGKNIADEIIHHYETHGVTRYYFADSLVNGSFRAFDDMCEHLARYRFNDKISWSGQYIVRSQRSTPAEHFDKLKSSGCETLFIGLESGSDKVRAEMGKNFTNDDVEFYLENFATRDVSVIFLMFTGYITETEHDHLQTLSMFPRWQRFVATGTIQGFETMNILSVLPGTPLEQMAQQRNFMFLVDHDHNPLRRVWVDPANPDFDFAERVRRHVDVLEHAIQYRWPLFNALLSTTQFEQALKQYKKMPKKYFPLRTLADS